MVDEYYYGPGDEGGNEPCDECEGSSIEQQASPTCDSKKTSGNSVILSTGQFVWSLPLLSVGGVGGGWSFSLDYEAGFDPESIVGGAFNVTQNLRLVQVPSGVKVITPDNVEATFRKVGDTRYMADAGASGVITVLKQGTPDEEYKLVNSRGVTSWYYGFTDVIATKGRLKRVMDRNANRQSYQWQREGGVDQLTQVKDTYGRLMKYSYYSLDQQYRLKEVEDFLGRKLNFQYRDGRLVAVVLPSIMNGAEGNTFPGGTAYVFQYDVTNPRPERQDDLVRIWYPNQVAPYLDEATRTVDVDEVYAHAKARYQVTYGQDPTDVDQYGRVISETVGDPMAGIGGTYSYLYTTEGLPENIIDPDDAIVLRCVMTDRNGNQSVYDFNAKQMVVREEVIATRSKNSLQATSFITWTKYNVNNQPVLVVRPEGDSTEYEYEDGKVVGIEGTFSRRVGLRLRETRRPGNPINIPSRAGSNGQTELTKRYFYEPLFNRLCGTIEERGNPIDEQGNYFAPQNGGPTPTDTDRSRYATIQYYDYQKNTLETIKNDASTQSRLGLRAAEIDALIEHVNQQMVQGGLPKGFEVDLGDINGDGTGNGASSGKIASKQQGNPIKVKHPSVRMVNGTWQQRVELYTVNDRGQNTTMTDPEGNVRVYVRYPGNDPEGDGQFVVGGLSSNQYGYMKEVHVDIDPSDVMSLVGSSGDLLDFVVEGVFPRNARTNTPGVHQDLTTRYEGGGSFGGGCSSCPYDALGNPLAVTDPKGFTTRYERNELGEIYREIKPQPYNYKTETHYDANRNVIRVDVEDRVVQYESEDPTSPDYAKFTPTGSGTIAQVPSKAGPGGSVRSGWFTNLSTYDLLDNRIEEDVDATGSTPSSLVTTYLYDANQNLIKLTKPEGNTIEYDYDERNLRIAERVGRDTSEGEPGAVTVWVYDGNGNLWQQIGPAARGGGGNHQTVVIDDAFRSGAALTHTGDWVVENTYDGFDRLTSAKDATGNVTTQVYDPANNIISSASYGPIGGPTPDNRLGQGNVRLAESAMRYDEAGRQYEQEQRVFLAQGVTLPSGRTITHTGGGLASNSNANDHTGTVTLTTGGESYVLSRTVFDRSGRVMRALQDNTAQTNSTYDGASRRLRQTDALGNIVDQEYDPNSNVVRIIRREKSTVGEPAGATEVFVAEMRYDALNRLVVQAQQGADGTMSADLSDDQTLFTLFGYDSRSNQTLVIDPKRNTAVTVFDGASRAIKVQQHLREDGQGDNGPEPGGSFTVGSVITTTTAYDGNGRVTALTDDRGAVTRFFYDTLDRQVEMEFNDGSTRLSEYDAAGDVIEYTDENGSVFTYTYDALGRRVSADIAPTSGVVGTTAQRFEYDGLSRQTQSIDRVDTTDATVEVFYDTLSRVIEDSQSYDGRTRDVTNDAFTSLTASGFTFPSGRQITNTYDLLYRRTEVGDTGGSSIAKWSFYGPNRVAEVQLGNGLICTHLNNARNRSAVQSGKATPGWGDQSSNRLGYDGAGRPMTKRYLAGGVNGTTHAYNNTAAVVGFTTAYDRASNKLYERELHAESRSHLYQPIVAGVPDGGYDSANRLLQYQRGVLASGGGGVTTAISLPGTDEDRTYDLDGLGNWKKTVYTPVAGSSTTENRTHNFLNELTQRKIGAATTNLTYDLAGNLLDDGVRFYTWDALNRLIYVRRKSDNTLIGEYVYDARGFRIRKVVTNGGLTGDIPGGTTDFIYNNQWQCVEERAPAPGSGDTPTKQYVWGIYIDELMQQRNDPSGTPADLYPLQDLLYRNTATTDASGTIVEAYDTDAYGNTIIYDAPGTGGNWWANDAGTTNEAMCRYVFTGREYDAETQNYSFRARYYTPLTGRFISRDPFGYADGDNLYAFAGSNSVAAVDPTGKWFCSRVCPDKCKPKHSTRNAKLLGVWITQGGKQPELDDEPIPIDWKDIAKGAKRPWSSFSEALEGYATAVIFHVHVAVEFELCDIESCCLGICDRLNWQQQRKAHRCMKGGITANGGDYTVGLGNQVRDWVQQCIKEVRVMYKIGGGD